MSALEPDAPIAEVLKRSLIPKTIVVICATVLLVLAGLLAATRFGVLLPQTRLLIEARTDGLKIGRVGRLKVEGLSGDLLRDFTIRRLTIRDEKGVWMEAKNVHMTWRYADLLRRRFHAEEIDAEVIRLLRRPTLTPKGKDNGLPVSFEIVRGRSRLEMTPAFSYRQGVYDLDMSLDIERNGGQQGKVKALSILHPGDHLNAEFDISKHRPLKLRIEALEAQGGALAGSLGLPANQPFKMDVAADGKIVEGRFTASATTGATQPLLARGAWTKAGGEASGRISLGASTLTAKQAARFGPEARFILVGRKAGPTLYALNGRVISRNLTVAAHGFGNLGEKRLGPDGLAVDASTLVLSRLTGGPTMGPAWVTGTIKGANDNWRFDGAGAATRLDLGAYQLGRFAGPIEITRKAGGWNLKSTLVGSGGRGAGWTAAALGAAPRASLDGARLADGRWSLKKLDVAGRGLKVEASGGRSLLGGLNFKGEATVSNLAEARPGASGSVKAGWSATQAGIGKPWNFTLDAEGARFATGYAELDRLLGPKPGFKAQANLQGRRLAVANADLDGAALDATTAGVLGADGGVTFKVDWNATGPFRAGPVEISGKAKGSGAVTGSLSAPRLDLLADVDAVDLPRLPLTKAKVTLSFLQRPEGATGLLAVTADSAYGPARARSAFRFAPGGVDLSELSLDAGGVKADGSVSLRRSTASAADLRVEITRGALLDAGRMGGTVRIVDAPSGPRGAFNLSGEAIRPVGGAILIRSARFSGEGPLSRLPLLIQAQGTSTRGPWKIDGRGVLSEMTPGYQLAFDGVGSLAGRDVHTTESAIFRFGGPERTARLRLVGAENSRIDLDGRLTADAASVQARMSQMSMGWLDQDLAGAVDAVLTIQGQGGQLTGTLEAKLDGARGRGAPAASGIDGTVRGRLAGDTITLDGSVVNADGLKANVDLVLPAESSAAPFRIAIARQRPMRGRFFAEGEVRPLWDLLIGGERSLSGQVRTEATLGGSIADPRLNGQVAVSGGKFEDGATGLSLRDVSIKAGFAQDAINVTQATGADGRGGTLSGAGQISLLRDGVSSFRLDLKAFRLIDNDQATASATGVTTIARTADGKVKLSGDLTVDRADVAADLAIPTGVVVMDVVEKNKPDDFGQALPTPVYRGSGWTLDVTLRAPRRVFLRGRGLDVELSLDARVTGVTTSPQLSGSAHVVRGDYDFAGKRFEFDNQSVVYLSTKPQNIRLDLTATRDDPTLTAVARIRGTAAKPEVTLTSTPSLPDDEVLSQVLFGRSASQLTALEAAQLASALSSLAGGGGLDVIGNLRSFARLDRLALAGGDASGVSVSGGKYLTDDVYLELTGGGREGPSAQVEWRVRRTLSIVSRLAGQGDGKLSIRWRKDY